jgi:NADPH:quinone reductase-like Zn-dependent oxidoreductase
LGPIPNPQSPIPNQKSHYISNSYQQKLNIYLYNILKTMHLFKHLRIKKFTYSLNFPKYLTLKKFSINQSISPNYILKMSNRSVRVLSFKEDDVEVVNQDIPEVKEQGDLLVNVLSASLNNYDTLQLQGKKGKVDFPIIPGHEACGRIVKAFSDEDKHLEGKLISFWANGVFCDYVVIKQKAGVVLPDEFDPVQGSVAYVNSITANGLVNTVLSYNTPSFIQTAANSSIGHMINKLAKLNNLKVINVVRTPERVKEMKASDYEYVLDMLDENFKTDLATLIKDLGAKVVIDPLSGQIATDLIKALPHGGTYINFGTHTGQPFSVDATDLRWGAKEIKSFLFTYWYDKQQDKNSVNKYIFENYNSIFKQNIQEVLPFWEFAAGLKKYNETSTPNARFIFTNEKKQ